MPYSPSADLEEVIKKQNDTITIRKNTKDQGAKSSSYNLYYDKTGAITEPIYQEKKKDLSNKKHFEQIAISEEVNRLLRKASNIVENLVIEDDPIEQSNMAFTFMHYLQDLWESSHLREPNWGELLNILQAVLAKVEFENLSVSQKTGIKEIVTEYLCTAEVTDSDMEQALEVLCKAGFDPLRGISGKMQE
jgi:hypothetical protein